MDYERNQDLKMQISRQFMEWHREGRDLKDYMPRAAFAHLRKLDPDWDTKYLEQLAGSHGWAIYKMLRIKYEQSTDTDRTAKTDPSRPC